VMGPALVIVIEKVLQGYLGSASSAPRIILCPDCQTEKRQPQVFIFFFLNHVVTKKTKTHTHTHTGPCGDADLCYSISKW
jgi:hypothetical protein